MKISTVNLPPKQFENNLNPRPPNIRGTRERRLQSNLPS